MSTFDQREDSFEKRYVHDEELRFKAEARRNKLLGIWAAELMSLAGDEARAYAADVVAADFAIAGDHDVFKKVAGDLKAKGIDVPDAVIRQKMASLIDVARTQVQNEG